MSEKKQRKLTEREAERLKQFEKVSAEMEEKGYHKTEQTMSAVKANIFALALSAPILIVGFVLYFVIGKSTGDFYWNSLVFLAVIVALIPVHELIHGLTWSIYAPNGWKDIDFGIMAQYLTPYCTCKSPLAKVPYIIGTLMPGIILGILPTVYAILSGSFMALMIGLIMIISAGGDIAIVMNLLKHRSACRELLVFDHPTEVGCCIFEK